LSSKKEKEKYLKNLLKDWVEKGAKARTKDNRDLNIDIVSSAVRAAISQNEITNLELKKMINDVRSEEVMSYVNWEGFEDRQKRFNALKSRLKELNLQV
jgi:polyribonucleotide nucleotidyltransferase